MKSLVLGLAVCVLVGCSTKVPLTYQLQEDCKIDAAGLKDLQVFNSKKIILTRAVSNEVAGKSKHDIRRVSDKYIEVVKIKKRTPGMIVGVDGDQVKVSFEDGTFFTFKTVIPETKKRPLAGRSYYRLMPDGKYTMSEKPYDFYAYGPFLYKYQGKEYASQLNRDVFLEVRKVDIEHVDKDKKILHGREFDDPCPCE